MRFRSVWKPDPHVSAHHGSPVRQVALILCLLGAAAGARSQVAPQRSLAEPAAPPPASQPAPPTPGPNSTSAPVNPAEALEMPTVVVIGTTPLPGLGTPIQDVPANVQVYRSTDIAHQGQTNLTDFMEQN